AVSLVLRDHERHAPWARPQTARSRPRRGDLRSRRRQDRQLRLRKAPHEPQGEMTGDPPLLDGITVVELAGGMAGAVTTLILAEVGADVITVEPPIGDPTRGEIGWETWNRSKRSIVLDLDDPADDARLHGLLAHADVFVHGLRPSAAAAVG